MQLIAIKRAIQTFPRKNNKKSHAWMKYKGNDILQDTDCVNVLLEPRRTRKSI